MSFTRKHYIYLGLAVLIAIAGCLLWLRIDQASTLYKTSHAAIGPQIVTTADMQYEVVTTPAAQERGLGGRAVIPDNYGMLFVFPSDSSYGYWMKDMLAPIDIIWVSLDGTIVTIKSSVSPATYPNVFYPAAPVRYVLETRAGFAAAHGWNVGSRISLPTPY